jgi:predicted HicB family RNase H-like nuclease
MELVMLEYKGYKGTVEYIEDSKIFHGEILGTKDVVTFQGTTVEEIETAFRESIDDYLDFCREQGDEPNKPYSGKFVVRLPELLHRYVAELAKVEHESLNTIVCRSLIQMLAADDRWQKDFENKDERLLKIIEASTSIEKKPINK